VDRGLVQTPVSCLQPPRAYSHLINRSEVLGDRFTVLGNHEFHAVLDPKHAPDGQDSYRTKADGRGTGLGLSIIKDIVTSHFSGRIDYDTKAGIGTTFNVTMNRVHESTPVDIPPSAVLEASSH
jgi:Histidine kinase-, DNA gyrase B-, and HSP90-like ATPase